MMLFSKTGTNPAAGSEIAETLTGDITKVIACRFTLVTSADVANRTVQFKIDDGTNVLWRKSSPVVQAASLTRIYNFLLDITDDATFDGDGEIKLALPPRLPLLSGCRLLTLTANLQAADNFSAPQLLLVEASERDEVSPVVGF